MKILFTNATSVKGGAARASLRNFDALKKMGANVEFWVDQKGQHRSDVNGFTHSWLKKKYHQLLYRIERRKILKLRNPQGGFWSVSKLNRYNVQQLLHQQPAIVHLNWINDNFLSVGELAKLDMPVVWTFHDMWAFTGGCHYSGDCTNYQTGCGECYMLNRPAKNDFSRQSFVLKEKALSNVNLTLVCPSTWMADMARSSRMFKNNRIEVIPNCLNTEVYSPGNKAELLKELQLDATRMQVLFGAVNSLSDVRKGGQLLLEVLEKLGNDEYWQNKIELVVFGSDKSSLLSALPFPIKYLGFITDENFLAKVYAAADLFLVTSREDNLPNTIMESMACGTPVAAFNVGGIKDMVDHQVNGYLAAPFDVDDYINGIKFILSNEDSSHFRHQCRHKVLTTFSEAVVAQRHFELYQELLKNSRNG